VGDYVGVSNDVNDYVGVNDGAIDDAHDYVDETIMQAMGDGSVRDITSLFNDEFHKE
jgi:hypothetical protein